MGNCLEELERLKAEYADARKATDIAVQKGCQVPEYLPAIESEATTRVAYHAALSRHADYLLSAAREAETLREDAARYRWLRDGGSSAVAAVSGLDSVDVGSSSCFATYEIWLDGNDLDAAIDSARKA